MAWSYSGNPGATTLDELRFRTGDTLEAVSLLTDEESLWLLAQYGTPAAAVLPALRVMLVKCSHDSLLRADGVEQDLQERRAALEARIVDVERTRSYLSVPFLGGVSVAERDRRRQEADNIQPSFATEQPEAPLDEDV